MAPKWGPTCAAALILVSLLLAFVPSSGEWRFTMPLRTARAHALQTWLTRLRAKHCRVAEAGSCAGCQSSGCAGQAGRSNSCSYCSSCINCASSTGTTGFSKGDMVKAYSVTV